METAAVIAWTSVYPCCICRSRPNKTKPKLHQNQKLAHPFSSSSTPAFFSPIIQTQEPKTKHQLLNQIIQDLQTSIDRGVRIGPEIFTSILETCYKIQAFHYAPRLHALIPPNLLQRSSDLSSKLLRLYALSGHIRHAHQLFDEMPQRKSVFAWNSLVSGYAEAGLYEDAMALYYQMEEEGVEPDNFTFPRVLKACAGIGLIQRGEAVHRHAIRAGYSTDHFVLNGLVDMYAKCGDIVKSRQVFDKITQRDLVSWNAMITGYIRHELLVEALETFNEMIGSGIEPDSVSISSLLAALPSAKLGFEIHGWILRHGLERSLSVANSLMDMYSKNGMLDHARLVFETMPEKDLVSWNTIISGYRKDGRALAIFHRMQSAGVLPDGITFVSLLSACAHARLVDEGRGLFEMMQKQHGIKPCMEHFACMVNLLGRSGLIDEALEFIMERVGSESGPSVWGALLFACSVYRNVEVGEIAAERLFELEGDNVHNYELLMQIYMDAGRQGDAEKVKKMIKDRGLY